MSSYEDHRWPVRAKNTTTGAARTWMHASRHYHFAWVLAMSLYTFIGWALDISTAEFAAWEVFFGLVWVALLSIANVWMSES